MIQEINIFSNAKKIAKVINDFCTVRCQLENHMGDVPEGTLDEDKLLIIGEMPLIRTFLNDLINDEMIEVLDEDFNTAVYFGWVLLSPVQ